MLKEKIFIAIIFIFTQQNLLYANDVKEKDVLFAIIKGVKVTESFLKKVPVYQIYKNDKTILHYAVELKKYDVVEFLLDKSDLSQKGGIYNQTALQDAIFYGNLGIAELLIVNGTDLNVQNIDGETALHIAAKQGYTSIIKLLIKSGALSNIRDEEDNTPSDVIPELIWDNDEELKKILTLNNTTGVKIISERQSITHSKKVTKSNIIINAQHKTIYKNSVEKSNVENSNIGMVID
jgi:ankyrin repeat protein